MLTTEIALVQMLVHVVRGRVAQARQADSGASTIEWALITAALVTIVLVVGAAILALVTRKANIINGL